MKKVMSILLILVSLTSLAQKEEQNEFITLLVTQDARLAFTEDDNGNKPYTADIRAKVTLQGYSGDIGHAEVQLGMEYADLSEQNFFRFHLGIAYSFTYMPLPFTDYKYEIAPFINGGVTSRAGNGATDPNVEIGVDIKFPIIPGVKGVGTVQYTGRNDIGKKLFEEPFSFGVGFEINILRTKGARR